MAEEQTPLIQYEEMLQAGMHFGRKRTVFNPKMGQYVFSVRDGICLIDLLKTQEELHAAINALNATLQKGGLVLFVAPTKQSQESVHALAEKANMPFVMDSTLATLRRDQDSWFFYHTVDWGKRIEKWRGTPSNRFKSDKAQNWLLGTSLRTRFGQYRL